MERLTLSDGRQLAYEVSGQGDALVFSNSLCAPYRTWDHLVERLDFQVIRYDQVGHGHSTSAPVTFERLADDVMELLKHLDIERVHYIGVSMGAATGVYFAARYPGVVRKLVVCDTISASPVNMGVDDVFAKRAKAAPSDMNAILDGTVERWFSKGWRDRNEQEVARIREIMETTSVDGFVACCGALSSKDFDLRPLVRSLDVEEVMLVVGESDANLPQTMAELKRSIEGRVKVRMEVVKSAGHVCYLDNLEGFLMILRQVLDGK